MLNLYGPIAGTGYGVHFANWAVRMHAHNQSAVLATGPISPPRDEEMVGKAALLAVKELEGQGTFHPNNIGICLQQQQSIFNFTGRRRLFYTVWEGSKPPMSETLLQKGVVDGWIVPTQWHANQLKGLVSQPVYVVHEGTSCTPVSMEFPDDVLRLVSIGKAEKRKCQTEMISGLIEASRRTKKRIELDAFWGNPFLEDRGHAASKAAMWQMKEELGGNEMSREQYVLKNVRVRLYLGWYTREFMESRIAAAHAGLFPFCAEGWGLPILDTMGIGRPVISPFYSGPTEYLLKHDILNVPTVEQPASDGRWFRPSRDGTWRVPTIDGIATAITALAEMDKSELAELGSKYSEQAQRFSWDDTVEQTLKAVADFQ